MASPENSLPEPIEIDTETTETDLDGGVSQSGEPLKDALGTLPEATETPITETPNSETEPTHPPQDMPSIPEREPSKSPKLSTAETPEPKSKAKSKVERSGSVDNDFIEVHPDTGKQMNKPQNQSTSSARSNGYALLNGAAANAYSYTVKIVNGNRAEQYRSTLQSIADELRSKGLADIKIAPGKYPKVSAPKHHEIYVYTNSTSPCGSQVLACARSLPEWRADEKTKIYMRGEMYILPSNDRLSAGKKRGTLAHEFGHLLGLDHIHDSSQLMSPWENGLTKYQAGDLKGLTVLHKNAAPKGDLSVKVPSTGKMRVSGWGFDLDSKTESAFRITVDGAVKSQSRTNLLRTDIDAKYSLKTSAKRGFDVTFNTPSKDHVVCLWVQNFPLSSYTKTSCRSATSKGTVKVDRLSGADRYATAVAVSKEAFPKTAPVVFVANGLNFPDALSAGPAARKLGGPLLLTKPTSLPANVKAEIRRLKPSRIVVVGGTASVNNAVGSQLLNMAKTYKRIAGKDRYDTSRQVVAYAFSSAAMTYVATGVNYPDALVAGSAAATSSSPLLLVNGKASAADSATLNRIKVLKSKQVRIIGGPATVSAGVMKSIKSRVPSTTRLSGPDRYSGAVAVSNAVNKTATGRAFVVTGKDFPEGLVSASLAGKTKSPVYLSDGACVLRGALQGMNRLGATRLTLIGGTNMLSTSVGQFRIC